MPTTRTLLRHFVKPLLERHPELVQHGIWLYAKPIRHVARFILIDRTGSSDRAIRWCADTLFDLHGRLDLRYGGPLYRSGLWFLDDPTAAPLFLAEAEAHALPSLRHLETLEAFHAFATDGFETWPWRTDGSRMCRLQFFKIRYAIVVTALGRFQEARDICRDLPADPWFKNPDFRPEFDRILDELYPLLIREDRPALARLLRSWEEFTIRTNKLEDLWEPTPFPFEEG